jgi:hypothetical protein
MTGPNHAILALVLLPQRPESQTLEHMYTALYESCWSLRTCFLVCLRCVPVKQIFKLLSISLLCFCNTNIQHAVVADFVSNC